MWNENAWQTIRKGKLTKQSDVGKEILYEMTTELQDFIWSSLPLHLCILF